MFKLLPIIEMILMGMEQLPRIINAAQQTKELTPEQAAELRSRFENAVKAPHWQQDAQG